VPNTKGPEDAPGTYILSPEYGVDAAGSAAVVKEAE
jgi:hypothetical protein